MNLSFLCTIIAKVKVSENDGLPGVLCRNCYNQIVNLRNKLGKFQSRSQTAQQKLISALSSKENTFGSGSPKTLFAPGKRCLSSPN